MNKITILCEENNNILSKTSLELISKAYELSIKANSLCGKDYVIEALCVCDELKPLEEKKAFKMGASKFVLIKNKEKINHSKFMIRDCFVEYYKTNKSDVILFPATNSGRQIAPLITSSLDCGLVADCINLDFIIKNEKLMLSATRPTFGSELMAEIISKKMPQCATIRPSIFDMKEYREENGDFETLEYNIQNKNLVNIISNIPFDSNEIEGFENVDVVLCAGYGLSSINGDYFKKLEEIAQKLGVKIGCTRKVVDYHYLPQKYQIGLTGSNMKAKLYIAFGVSGALQHMCSAKNADKIVAINTDEEAEIFKYADYKIVKCAKQVIDELYNQIII